MTTKVTTPVIDSPGLESGQRNFIIDGSFTSFPEDTVSGMNTGGDYGPALWVYEKRGSSPVVFTMERDTSDVPTVAQSGTQFPSCLKITATTGDAALAAGDGAGIRYGITGSTLAQLHGQEVTFDAWVKITGITDSAPYKLPMFMFASDAGQSYVKDFTIASNNTWTRITHTFTLDVSAGAWPTTESVGGWIGFAFGTGSTYQGTDETWEAAFDMSTSSSSLLVNENNDVIRITGVGLYLGSTAPTFTSEPIATVKDQVAYYISRYEATTALDHIGMARAHDATRAFVCVKFPRPMRVAPTISYSATGDIGINNATTLTYATALSSNEISNWGYRFMVTVGSSVFTVDEAYVGMLKAVGDFVQFDARH